MSNNRIELQGLQDFRTALLSLPDDLTQEAGQIVQDTAQDTGAQVSSHYPVGPTGNLRNRVRVDMRQPVPGKVIGIVRSQSPIAGIFEKGTKDRSTRKGWRRGRMPAAPPDEAMVPRAIRARARMTGLLIDLLRKAGFEVNA